MKGSAILEIAVRHLAATLRFDNHPRVHRSIHLHSGQSFFGEDFVMLGNIPSFSWRGNSPKTNMTMQNHLKMYLSLNMAIFHCHVSFQGSKSLEP